MSDTNSDTNSDDSDYYTLPCWEYDHNYKRKRHNKRYISRSNVSRSKYDDVRYDDVRYDDVCYSDDEPTHKHNCIFKNIKKNDEMVMRAIYSESYEFRHESNNLTLNELSSLIKCCDINAKDKFNKTLLMYAAESGSEVFDMVMNKIPAYQ